jgi:hypothetical protein
MLIKPANLQRSYQELLLSAAGRVATLLMLTGSTCGRIVSLEMEGILFQGILAWVIHCYK